MCVQKLDESKLLTMTSRLQRCVLILRVRLHCIAHRVPCPEPTANTINNSPDRSIDQFVLYMYCTEFDNYCLLRLPRRLFSQGTGHACACDPPLPPLTTERGPFMRKAVIICDEQRAAQVYCAARCSITCVYACASIRINRSPIRSL